jgi:hypothetical protein
VQDRVEASPSGRAVISAFVVLTALAILLTSIPASPLRRTGDATFRPYIDAVGLDQNWEVFAPDPRRIVLDFEAEITYDDASTAVWRVPRGGMIVDTYRFYHWQKWMEHARADDTQAVLWEPAARFAAREMALPGKRVVKVELVRYWYDIPAPGEGSEHEDFNRYVYYTLEPEASG